MGYVKKQFNNSLNLYKTEWSHKSQFEKIILIEDKKVKFEEIELICQLSFRYYLNNISLEIKDKFYVHFGYDMYMYVGARNISEELINKLNKTSIFVEEHNSPYHFESLQYELLKSKKRSKYVFDKQILNNLKIEEIKKILKLSDEHSGRVHIKINKKIAFEFGLELDFPKYDYYLTSEELIN